MGFEALLGNTRLKENLRQSVARGHISHFYLISGPAGSGKHTLARLLAAAGMCKSNNAPCLCCSACRKVMADTHPDFITVDDPEKKSVPVDLIRSARADIYVQPNEADRKIYLFPRAQDMAAPAQNALLKVLEEPPAYGVFLLLTDNPEALLPTIRSRCVELKLQALPDDLLRQTLQQRNGSATQEEIAAAAIRSGGYLGQAIALLENKCQLSPQTQAFSDGFAQRDTLALTLLFVKMERWKRDALIEELTQWQQLLHSALLEKNGQPAVNTAARGLSAQRSAAELNRAIGHLKTAIEYAQGNVAVAAICGWLTWALR